MSLIFILLIMCLNVRLIGDADAFMPLVEAKSRSLAS